MHVGYTTLFQNPDNAMPDGEVYREEVRLAELTEPLGFDSIWGVEHHFTDYTMCPDVLQFLTYMAGRTSRIKLGSSVIVLPWHDPMRVAEQISMLDHLSGGRMILGFGRGLGNVELSGFRINQGESRARFVEYAEMLIEGLERGWLEGGDLTQQPRRDIRPFPLRSFRGRTYAAAVSPESMPHQVLEKLAHIRDVIGPNAFMATLSYAGMPYDEAERNLRCFASHILPELRAWSAAPLAEPRSLDIRAG
ncbi:MAG: LLM class flavin-dependent oxidoreductase [Gammaproteobacteria bacterium]